WYSYKISGIDIFGRHSQLSAPARWHQWAPMPQPRPWYYEDPPGMRQLSNPACAAFAIALRDMTPPPRPGGVEAWALDPRDPLLMRDAAYQAWRATLSAAERDNPNLIGLRVRWTWTSAQMYQAPDTQEFRIYYDPDTSKPQTEAEMPAHWQRRLHVVKYDEHVMEETRDANGTLARTYELFLPAAGDSDRSGLPLTTSLAVPIAHALIGVSAADGKTHAPDQITSGRWGSRPGNEGAIGPVARIFRVQRTPPERPVLHPDIPRAYATPADYHGHATYTLNVVEQANVRWHVYRALDQTVFATDWMRGSWDAITSYDDCFPASWSAAKVTQVAAELNQVFAVVRGLGRNAAGWNQAQAAYRGLSDDALRVLASLSSSQPAFTQITIAPINGPTYEDRLDGRASNRYFYRTAFVDGAQNRSAQLSVASPPVYLPRVTPPAPPIVTSATGGERAITLRWTASREPDVVEYRVYRTDDPRRARDPRLMTQVGAVTVAADIGQRPVSVEWIDTPVPGLVNYWYCLVAVDRFDPATPQAGGGNLSLPSAIVQARAVDETEPAIPPLEVERQTVAGQIQDHVRWTSTEETLLQRQYGDTRLWETVMDWLAPGTQTFDLGDLRLETPTSYRLRVRKPTGATAIGQSVEVPGTF
ncbi:MAG TPA: hypothetical protein VD886_26625, partial [Herpetosiphonaceae bacterium]|nr:hypothetical protein [Herpetosiphonaceae bacterium]